MSTPSLALPYDLKGHVALITGANHGIGAATASALADCGARVLVSYLRLSDPEDSGFPEPYRANRSKDGGEVLALIRSRGGQAVSLEADLRDATTPARLFDFAERELGPVDILVNNQSPTRAGSQTECGCTCRNAPTSSTLRGQRRSRL